jgi:hypothetical protein
MVPSGVGPWGQTHGGRDMGSCCSILHFLLLVNPRGVDGGWGRVVATDYAAPENIFAHFWRGVPRKISSWVSRTFHGRGSCQRGDAMGAFRDGDR